MRGGHYYSLDEVGARFWELLVEQGSVLQVQELLLSEFDVEPERLSADLARLIDELLAAGLIVATETQDSARPSEENLPRRPSPREEMPFL